MDFNGNLLTRCGKTYLRAFLSWITGMALSCLLNNQGIQYLRREDEQIMMANSVSLFGIKSTKDKLIGPLSMKPEYYPGSEHFWQFWQTVRQLRQIPELPKISKISKMFDFGNFDISAILIDLSKLPKGHRKCRNC